MTGINGRQPLVRRGTGIAHALSVAQRVHALQAKTARARRRINTEYGREADPMVTLLLDRLEARLEDVGVTADALLNHLALHSPAPRDDSAGARLCLNPSCLKPLYGMKSTAKQCSNVCRAEVDRLKKLSGAYEVTDEYGTLRLVLPPEPGVTTQSVHGPV